eukprot:scaffold20390_cov22-Tisochrysis_lutea.AAC.1
MPAVALAKQQLRPGTCGYKHCVSAHACPQSQQLRCQCWLQQLPPQIDGGRAVFRGQWQSVWSRTHQPQAAVFGDVAAQGSWEKVGARPERGGLRKLEEGGRWVCTQRVGGGGLQEHRQERARARKYDAHIQQDTSMMRTDNRTQVRCTHTTELKCGARIQQNTSVVHAYSRTQIECMHAIALTLL